MLNVDKAKRFVKKHHGKIIIGAAAIAGMVIAYNCGTHEVVARLRGNYYQTLITKNRNWAKNVGIFFEESMGPKMHRVDAGIPVDEAAEYFAKKLSELPEGYKTINILTTAKK